MKRTKPSSLLAAAAAVAGVAMGAGLALADVNHPPVTLYTYEEVAQQMGFPAAPVMINNVTKQGMPYSPKQTCFGNGMNNQGVQCHGDNASNPKLAKNYDALSKHAFHSSLGINEWMDNDPSGRLISPDQHDLTTGAGSTPVTIYAGQQTGLAANKPWLQSHGHNGKW
jgi:hypothetical protein